MQGVSKSFRTLKAYINFFRRHVQCFELSQCSKPDFYWDSYGSVRLLLVMHGVSKRVLHGILNVAVWRVSRKRCI
jgi:hypothetical protein